MTNEEIVNRIQSGEKDLIADLWEVNQALVYKIAWHYTKPTGDYPPYYDETGRQFPNPDILQELYLAMVDAVDSYNPDRGANFISFYYRMAEWHLISYFKTQALIKGHPDAVMSLDYTYNAEGDTMADFISDDGECSDSMEDDLYRQQLRRVWDILPKHLTGRENEVIFLKYKDGECPDSMSEHTNLSKQRLYDLEQSAIKKLRRCREIQNLHGGQTHLYYMGSFERWRERQESCVESVAVENALREKKRHRRKAEDMQALEQELEEFFGIPS